MGAYDADIQLTVGLTPDGVIQTAVDLNDEVRRIFNDASGADVSVPFRKLQISMDDAAIRAKNLLNSMNELQQSGQAYSDGVPTDKYLALSERLNQVNNQMVLLIATANEMSNSVETTTEPTNRLQTIFTGLSKAMMLSVKPMQLILSNLSKIAASTLRSGIKKLGDSIKNLGKHSGSTGDAFNKGFKMFIRYGLGVRSLFALINKLRRALIEGFGNLAQVNEPFNRAMSEMMTALNTLKNSFASAFAPIIEVVSPILTHFINLLAEAVTKVGMFIATLTGKSSYARALPVYQDYAASVDKTSKSSKKAAKATKDQNKAAKELKRTLAGFDDIEILEDNKDTGTGTSGTDGTNIADSVASAFETVPLGSAFEDLAKKLKDAWKNADFTEIGKLIGEKLKSALDSIPWDKIKDTLKKIAKSIATFLNGFLETPGLFTSIGTTLGEAFNSAFEFLESFITNFHWSSLGTAIRDLIVSALETVDWELIYRTMKDLGSGIGEAINSALDDPTIWSTIFTSISNGLNSIVYGVDSFLTTVHWGSIAANIGNGLNDGIEAFDWNALADTLSDLINSVFDIWYNFITTFDFEKFGKHIGETLSNAVKKISWSRGATSIAQTINKLYSALNGFIATTDWETLAKVVVNAIATFFKTLDWTQFGTFLSLCFIKLLNVLTTIIKEIDWDNLPGNITKAIKDFLVGFDWQGLLNSVGGLIGAALKAVVKIGGQLWEAAQFLGRNIISGAWRGITDKLKGIGRWIVTHIFNPFINGFKSAFGIGSPSKEMKPYGRYIIMGLFNGIIAALGAVAQWIRINIFNPIINAIKSVFGIGSDESSILTVGKQIINSLLSGISKVLEGINTWITDNVFTPIKTAFETAFGLNSEDSSLLSIGSSIIKTVLSGITNVLADIGTFVYDNIFTPFKNAITDKFGLNSEESGLLTIGTDIIGKIKDGVVSAMADIADWIKTNIVEPIIGGLQDLVSGVTGLFSDNGEDQLFINYCETSTEAANTYADAMEYLKTKVEGTDGTMAWRTLNDAIKELARTQTISADDAATLSAELYNSEVSGMSFGDAINNVSEFLQNHNVKVEDLNRVLGLTPDATTEAAGGFDGLKESADESDASTGELHDSITGFNKLSWLTPIKIALISGAIDTLQSSGKLSKEQVGKLKEALSKYNAKPTTQSMQKIENAFKDAGIKAEDFETAVYTASNNLPDRIKPGVQQSIQDIYGFSEDAKTGGETLGNNITTGMKDTIETGASEVKSAGGTMVSDTINEMYTEADSHSPSEKTRELGKNIVDGLKLGMEEEKDGLLSTVSDIIADIISSFGSTEDFNDAGANIITAFASGLNSSSGNVTTTAYNIGIGVSSSLQVDGWTLGYNICSGIYDGLNAGWGWLTNTAWNLAISIYNTACNALGIASPSKLFKDKVGKMIPLGLAEGIEDNSDSAVGAIDDMTKDIENAAEDADPVISFTTNVENFITALDDILTTFSDKITNGFSSLIDDLNNLTLPDVVSGKTIPYKSNISTSSQESAKISEVLDRLDSEKITRQDLISIFSDLFKEYLDISFYLGDEQIYRHAERGALKINRRYNPVVN